MRAEVLAQIEALHALPPGAARQQRQIALENEEPPALLAALFAERERLPPGPAGWITRMAGAMGLPDRPVQPFRRRDLAANALFYEGTGQAPRRLLVVFAGRAQRPMMPVATFLQRLPADRCDVLLLRDPARQNFTGGVEGYGEGFAALAPRILADLPGARAGGIRCLGVSQGGAASLYAGLLLATEQAVAIGGAHPAPKLARLPVPGLDGHEMDRALDAAGRRGGATRLVALHAAEHARDAATAADLKVRLPGLHILAMAGTAEHNLPAEMLAAGRLDGFLHRVAFGDFADGGLW